MIKNSPYLKWIYLLVLALIWGSSFILMKRGLLAFRPDQVAAIRMSVACIATFPVVMSRLKSIPLKNLKYLAVVGMLGSGIPAFLFATAQTRINSSLAGMLNGLTPFFTMIVGSLFFRSKFTSRQIAGVMIGFVGAAGLILIRSDGNGFSSDAGYAALIVVATLCYGVSVNTIKTYLHELDAILISGAALLFVGIPYCIYLFTTDFLVRLTETPGGWEGFGFLSILAVMGTAVSSVFYFHMVKISSPLFASAVTYLIPVVALGWGVADGEALSALHMVAFATILAGVALISRPKKA